MGTKKIDIVQSAQIAALEADILELRTKINLVVTDLHAISAKLNILITDLNDINAVVMAGYTTPGSPQGHGILQEMADYTNAMDDHANLPINTSGSGGPYIGNYATHFYKQNTIGPAPPSYAHPAPGVPGPPPPYQPGAGGDGSTPGGTGQHGNAAHDSDAEDANVNASYLNKERILSVKGASANRAKRLARQTLNRLRK